MSAKVGDIVIITAGEYEGMQGRVTEVSEWQDVISVGVRVEEAVVDVQGGDPPFVFTSDFRPWTFRDQGVPWRVK